MAVWVGHKWTVLWSQSHSHVLLVSCLAGLWCPQQGGIALVFHHFLASCRITWAWSHGCHVLRKSTSAEDAKPLHTGLIIQVLSLLFHSINRRWDWIWRVNKSTTSWCVEMHNLLPIGILNLYVHCSLFLVLLLLVATIASFLFLKIFIIFSVSNQYFTLFILVLFFSRIKKKCPE